MKMFDDKMDKLFGEMIRESNSDRVDVLWKTMNKVVLDEFIDKGDMCDGEYGKWCKHVMVWLFSVSNIIRDEISKENRNISTSRLKFICDTYNHAKMVYSIAWSSGMEIGQQATQPKANEQDNECGIRHGY